MQSAVQRQFHFASGGGWPWCSLLIALTIEMLIIFSFAINTKTKPALPKPVTVQIHMVAPAPKPDVPPTPPKPVAPPPPQPVIPPAPPAPIMPPPPKPVASPMPKPPLTKPVIQHVIQHVAHPKPQQKPQQPIQQAVPALPVAMEKTPALSASEQATIMDKYVALVRSQIQSNLQIPPQLVALQQSGDCTLKFTLAPDGHMLAVAIIKSSGVGLVDQTALAALKSAPLPAFLKGMPQEPHSFSIIVHVSAD